jgi:hypothetical protein
MGLELGAFYLKKIIKIRQLKLPDFIWFKLANWFLKK